MRVLVLGVVAVLVFLVAYWVLMGPPFVLGLVWPTIWLFFTGGHQRPARAADLYYPPVWLALLVAAGVSLALTVGLDRVSARLGRLRKP